MRRSGIFILMVMCAALVIAASTAAAAPAEFFTNGGFEIDTSPGDGMPDGWTGSKLVIPQDGQDCTVAHSGSCSFRFAETGSKKKLTQTAAASGAAGDLLLFSFWYRDDGAADVDKPMQIQATVLYAGGGKGKFKLKVPAGAADWTRVEFPFYPQKDYTGVTITIKSNKTTTTWLDDMSFAAAVPADLEGCTLFPADNYWNTPVTGLAVHPQSAGWIAYMGADRSPHADFGAGLWDGGPIGIPYNVVHSSGMNPAVIGDIWYPDETDPGPYYIPDYPQIEGGPKGDGDRHVLIVDADTCELQEVYHAVPDGHGAWDIGSAAVWDLSSNLLRPDTWTSADAAGLPILPGLVRYEEAAAGAINHAIRFTAAGTANYYLWPARHVAGSNPAAPPFGARFRLKASYTPPPGTPSEVLAIIDAMKTYGIVLADNGSNWYISGVPDSRWDNDALRAAFDTITGQDFEAVDTACMMISADSAQASLAGCP